MITVTTVGMACRGPLSINKFSMAVKWLNMHFLFGKQDEKYKVTNADVPKSINETQILGDKNMPGCSMFLGMVT